MDRNDADRSMPADDDAPVGGAEITEEQMEADDEVEQDTIASVDPAGSPG